MNPIHRITDTGTRYLQGQHLGSGGFGITYLATREESNEQVVLKILHPGANAEERARFCNEYETLRLLQSPRIVKVLDANLTHQTEPFIVMELVRGGALLDEIVDAEKAKQPIDRSRIRALVVDTLRALSECHNFVVEGRKRPILHRDLTPGNIMLTGDGEEVLTRLIDFGLSRVGSRQNTVSGTALGTMYYMSPEHCDGKPTQHTPSMDVFSMALVIRELIAAGTSLPKPEKFWFLAADEDSYDPLERLRDLDAPEPVREVLARCLERDPKRRYVDAGEMLAALLAAWPEGSAAISPCEELAQLQWEGLIRAVSTSDRTIVVRRKIDNLRVALVNIDTLVMRAERQAAEARRRLQVAVEVLEEMLTPSPTEPTEPSVLGLRENYLTMLGEMCRGLPEDEFDPACKELREAIDSRDVELFQGECDAWRHKIKKHRKRHTTPISREAIARRLTEAKLHHAREAERASATQVEIESWYARWSHHLATWEQRLRAEAREFHGFCAVVTRLQRTDPATNPPLADDVMRDEILNYTKKEPEEELKKLYRVYIRRVHPDLAIHEGDVLARNLLTRMLNEAYDSRDLQKLKDVIDEIELAGREVDSEDPGTMLLLELNGLKRILRSCAKILEEYQAMTADPLYALWSQARSVTGVDPIDVVRRHLGLRTPSGE